MSLDWSGINCRKKFVKFTIDLTIIQYFNYNHEVDIHTDASQIPWAGIIQAKDSDSKLHLIPCTKGKFQGVSVNHFIYEKEFLQFTSPRGTVVSHLPWYHPCSLWCHVRGQISRWPGKRVQPPTRLVEYVNSISTFITLSRKDLPSSLDLTNDLLTIQLLKLLQRVFYCNYHVTYYCVYYIYYYHIYDYYLYYYRCYYSREWRMLTCLDFEVV